MTTPIPKTMFAWRKHRGKPDAVWEEVPVPTVPPTGFLCRVLAAGVCHSDHALMTRDDPRPWFEEVFTLGHEGCGEILRIGQEVKDDRFHVGDAIAFLAVPGCGQDSCVECSRDLAQLCKRGHHSGIGQDGFYAPYATIDVRGAVSLPKAVSPAAGAVATDAVTTAYHAVTRRAEVKANETIFLFGLGGLGFNGLQIVHHIGARVIVSDIREGRLKEAVNLGIPESDIVPAGKPVQEFVKEHGLEDSIDTVLDFAGTTQTFEDAQHIVRRGGKITQIGTLGVDTTMHLKLGVGKRLSVIFSYGGQKRDLEAVLDLISNGIIKPQVETGQLKDFPTALRDLHEGKIAARIALMP